jgi:hypothetical protein|tara:strand:- start:48 stop:530 length:483 start_codon:yes stop_codon:yes gene_type:complete
MRSGIMTKKKKKKNYIDFEADAGQGFENFDKPPTRINVFDRARKIKTWNMFIHLVEQENISPADALTIILKHVKKSWDKYKILNDPDQAGAIIMLLDWQDKMGARKLYDHKYLNDFCAWTGYKKKSFSRFQDDLSMFKAKFGGKRKKKKVPHFIDKEFKI